MMTITTRSRKQGCSPLSSPLRTFRKTPSPTTSTYALLQLSQPRLTCTRTQAMDTRHTTVSATWGQHQNLTWIIESGKMGGDSHQFNKHLSQATTVAQTSAQKYRQEEAFMMHPILNHPGVVAPQNSGQSHQSK